jgi:anhydro-N-acetylmuramic acid kinase
LPFTSLSYDSHFRTLMKAAELAARKAAGNLELAKLNYDRALKTFLIAELGTPPAEVSACIAALNHYFHGNAQTPVTFDQIVTRSTELHIEVVQQLLNLAGYTADNIDLIGYHGQTLFHCPGNTTLQVGDAQLLADKTGITVISNFRSKDVAAGGQGAPLVPLFHQALAVRDNNFPAAVVNCGGIANISLITGKHETELIGFDTGPGNCLIDRYVRLKSAGKEQMDTNGKYGLNGKVSEKVLARLYKKAIFNNGQNYFDIIPPKSLDIGELHLIPELDELSIADACATLEAFTADTIVNGLKYFAGDIPPIWILAGGGWHNPVITRELIARLTKLSPNVKVLTAEEANWSSSALESQTFAYLAARSLQKLHISLPSTTRVPQALTGGDIYLPVSGATTTVTNWLAQTTV